MLANARKDHLILLVWSVEAHYQAVMLPFMKEFKLSFVM